MESIFTLSIKRPSKWYIIYCNQTKMTELHLFEIDKVSKVRSALGTPLRKCQIKIILDVKSLFGALGLLDWGLNEHIFVKIWNSTKINIFPFFVCSSTLDRVHSDSFRPSTGPIWIKLNYKILMTVVSAGVKQLFLNPAVQYISHQTWLALWEIVSAYPVSINMPGCHFNDSWLEEVKYKI